MKGLTESLVGNREHQADDKDDREDDPPYPGERQ
jgi:hypothetical protein